jgi:hypothetical protein
VKARRNVRDFRLPPPSEWDLRSSDMLCGVGWYLPTFRDNLSVPSHQGSSITANLCNVTCQKSEPLEVTSLIIIGGPPVVECLGGTVWRTDRLSTPLTWVLSGGDSTASNYGHFNALGKKCW